MTANHDMAELDQRLDRLEAGLPGFAAKAVSSLRQPRAVWLRIPIALLFIGGGFLGFLPILGFWMLPVGVLLLAHDVPVILRPALRALSWTERSWSQIKSRLTRKA